VIIRNYPQALACGYAGKLIRMVSRNIPVLGRNTQGVKLMDLDPEDRIVSIGRVAED
jgi:DNA gyrase subunit A